MNFVLLFLIITGISLAISVSLFLLRKQLKGTYLDQEYIHSSVFSFFTTLYAFFIGFAIVTLWTAYLHAQANVTKEADAILTVHRIAQSTPGTEELRISLINYVQSVIEDEWPAMERDSMCEKTARHFNLIWEKFYQLNIDPQKGSDIRDNLAEASRQRLARAILLKGNLYPPVWVILIFGFVSVVFGLYFLNRQQNLVSVTFEFMVIFLVLACLYFIHDIDTTYSGFISVEPEVFQKVLVVMKDLR
jgi:hypothetical protein